MDAVGALIVAVVILLVVWALMIVAVWRAAPSRATVIDVVRLLPDLVRLATRLARDPATPRSSRLALAGLAMWIASPIDLIPEFIPVIGPLDDIVVAAIVLRWVGRRVGEDALRAHWPGSPDGFDLVLRLLGTRSRERSSRADRTRTASTSSPRPRGARRTHPRRMPSWSA